MGTRFRAPLRDHTRTTTHRDQLTTAATRHDPEPVDDRDATPGTRPCPDDVKPPRSRSRPPPQAHRWIEAKCFTNT